MDSERVKAITKELLQTTPAPLVCAYLYGSHATGQAEAGSDVDVAVLTPEGRKSRA